MSELQYSTVDRVLAKVHRDLKGTDLNESDAIEWIGEALEFLRVPQIQEQAIAFMEINNYEAKIPCGFQMVLQVARQNDWTPDTKEDCAVPVESLADIIGASCDSCDSDLSYIPYFEVGWEYESWTSTGYYQQNFTPVRLADNTFFNSIVCKEKDQTPYKNDGQDEYTIVGITEKKLRVSFEQGYIALAYVRNVVDKETGYPLVPDNISYVTAITYYLKWKIAQMYSWNGRQNFIRLAQDNERLWLKYARQAKNYMKMPKTIDQFQNLLEQSHYLIPRHRRYYGYFGNLGREENRIFNDPDTRNRL